MAKRRKFLAGLGALASGSAAALGTGAFSQATASGRSVTVEVVGDESGYLGLLAEESGLENDQYASLDGDGQIELNFDETAGSSGFAGAGGGVGGDSQYFFDSVFAVANLAEEYTYNGGEVDASNVTPQDAFGVYSIGGRPDIDDLENANVASVGGINPGQYNDVGIAINTENLTEGDQISGTITISMDDRASQS